MELARDGRTPPSEGRRALTSPLPVRALGARAGSGRRQRCGSAATTAFHRRFPTTADLLDAIVDELATRPLRTLDETVARIDAGSSAVVELTLPMERMGHATGQQAVPYPRHAIPAPTAHLRHGANS